MIPRDYRKQIHSATYFLVFVLGMDIPRAERVLELAPKLIPSLAEAGSEHWRQCERALIRWIDADFHGAKNG